MKSALPLFFLLFTLSLSAQSRKGKIYISGTTSLASDVQSTTASEFFLPEGHSRVGYYLTDRILLGGDPFQGSVFARYAHPLDEIGRLRAFVELNFQFGYGDGFANRYEPTVGIEYEALDGVLLTGSVSRNYGSRSNYGTYGVNTSLLLPLRRDKSWKGGRQFRGGFFLDPIYLFYVGRRAEFSSYSGLDLHLGGGYFLTNRLAVTGSFTLGSATSEGGVSFVERDSWRADAGLRYYQPLGDSRFRPYLEAGIYASQSITDLESTGQPDYFLRDNHFTPYLGAGTNFFVSDKVALDLGIQYNVLRSGVGFSDRTTDRFGIGLGTKLFLTRE